jgi:hypothetical protein
MIENTKENHILMETTNSLNLAMQNSSVEVDRQSTKGPIFILGSGRSGTSVLNSALRMAAKIPGYPEGHFIPLIGYLMPEIDRFYKAKQHAINKKHAIGHISPELTKAEILQSIKNICNNLFSESQWVDKSPGWEAIEIAPYLHQAWNNSYFIFAKRRGIECMISRLKKFPNTSFEKHCEIWSRCMRAWLAVRDSLSHCSIEIDQRAIALCPQETAENLGNFLNLETQQTKEIEEFFCTKRPQSTGTQESEVAISLEGTGWSQEKIDIFLKICGDVSQSFGYSETSSYYQ